MFYLTTHSTHFCVCVCVCVCDYEKPLCTQQSEYSSHILYKSLKTKHDLCISHIFVRCLQNTILNALFTYRNCDDYHTSILMDMEGVECEKEGSIEG